MPTQVLDDFLRNSSKPNLLATLFTGNLCRGSEGSGSEEGGLLSRFRDGPTANSQDLTVAFQPLASLKRSREELEREACPRSCKTPLACAYPRATATGRERKARQVACGSVVVLPHREAEAELPF